MRAAPAALHPAAPDATPLRSLVFETLVRLDVADAPQPCLALSWQHDATARRWQFNLRPGVKFHDGSPLTAAAVAASLQEALPGLAIGATADAVTMRANHPLPDLLLELAHNGWLGTGPSRVPALDPGRRATFAANEDYWGGRPFLDAIDVQLGRGLRDQLADLEFGKVDVVEVGPSDQHRASEHGRTVWSSAPVSLIALAFAPALDPRLREALALSIDRAAMYTVLLQKQGEVSAALLPQWISGYAFAFPTAPDLARARALANALPPAARPSRPRRRIRARTCGWSKSGWHRSTRRGHWPGSPRPSACKNTPSPPMLQTPHPPRRSTNPNASSSKASARFRSFSFPFSPPPPAASASMRRRQSRAWAIGASDNVWLFGTAP